jgi:ribosomal protein S18 acetylase RimI-like enzyme
VDAITFRTATSSDAAALGDLHVASWRETYAGFLPDQMLNALSTESRSAMWSAILNQDAHWQADVFVSERDGAIVGFGACGGQRDNALLQQGFDGEIGAIYVRRASQGCGVGRSLMGLMAKALIAQRRTSAALWVLRENVPARRFYEKLGGILAGEKVEEESGAVLTEVAYGWSDLSSLLE